MNTDQPTSPATLQADGRPPRAARLPVTPALAAALGLLLVVAGAAYWFQQQADDAIDWRKLTSEIRVELSALEADVMELSRGLRGYAISGKEDWLEPYRDARKAAPERVRRLKGLTAHNPVMQRHLDLFDDRMEIYLIAANKTLALAAEKGMEAARSDIASGAGRAELQRMEEILTDMDAEQARLFKERDAAAERNTSLATGVTILGNLFALAMMAWAGVALNRTIVQLRAAAAQTAAEDWAKSGLVKIGQRLQGGRDPVAAAQALLSELAPHLGAQHAVFYAPEGAAIAKTEGAADGPPLRLIASYAYRERKHLAAGFHVGEGLVGQCALEHQRILLQQAPPDYIRITSGLGESGPLDVVVLPVLHEARLHGVLELASLQRFTPHQLAFLDQLTAQLGILFNAMAASRQVDAALAHSEELTQELRVREEELKANNEELQEQTRRLEESQSELKTQQEELQVTNEELEEKSNQLEKERASVLSKNRELEAAQVALEERAEQLTVTGKYKSEFLANMSHELRTPLNSLLLLSQMLSDNKEGNLTPKQLEYVRTIHASGDDLLNLINEILDLSKIEAGRLEISPGPVALETLVQFAESNFRPVADQKKLTFEITVAGDLPNELTTDEQRLEQVLRNLLSNALKFTERGRVSLAIGRPAAGVRFEHEALRRAGAGVIAFTVTDTGIGIPAGKQAAIWEAFQQADSSVTRKFGGTGLGLTISREITRLLGGEIHLRSDPGQGSTFTLYMPESLGAEPEPHPAKARPTGPAKAPSPRRAAEMESPAAEERRPVFAPVHAAPREDDRESVAARPAGTRVVLVIEDDKRFASVLRDLAREHGFLALVSGLGGEGLQLARQHRPDCILLDLGLPDMDGEEVLRTVLADPQLRRTPVEVISGHERGRQLVQEGAFAFLQKPVSPNALEQAFEKLESYLTRGPRRVLVVEDEIYARDALVQLTETGDVAVTAVGTGRAALEALRRETFDALILDLKLPDMDGGDLLEKIHTDLGIAGLPVIVHTACSLGPEEERALRRQAHSIIVKSTAAPQRLLDDLGLFLDGVKERLPAEKRALIRQVRAPASPLAGRTVLVVDDDMRNVFSLTALLDDNGMNVLSAENGRAALDLLAQHPEVSIVLMDIMMPEMDGYEATRRLRREKHGKDLPVIALTAKAMKGDREKCLEAGASDYLAKPVDAGKLLSLLRVWLAGSDPAETPRRSTPPPTP